MRILLVQPLSFFFSTGGAHKANRLLIEGLARRGHVCRVMTQLAAPEFFQTRAQFRERLREEGTPIRAAAPGIDVVEVGGVEVHVLQDYLHMCEQVSAQARDFGPEVVLVSEDKPQVMLGAALEAEPSRVVYIAHSPVTLPFGPDSFSPDPLKAEMLRRVAGVITVSNYMKEYVERYGGIRAAAYIPFPVYGAGPFPNFGRFDGGYVTLVNACEIKGLTIFAELARRLTDVEFAAVRSWGSTEAVLAPLRRLTNLRVLDPDPDIDKIFARTRVLLAPSLWGEAFGQIVVEAMLRGVPVLASDSGGLPEAKLGLDYVLPVRTIEKYEPTGEALPRVEIVPVIPEQDVGPWERALGELLSSRELYERLSRSSREAAHAFVARIKIEAFEEYLEGVATGAAPAPEAEVARARKAQELLARVGQLSAGRRELLARRLQGMAGAASRK